VQETYPAKCVIPHLLPSLSAFELQLQDSIDQCYRHASARVKISLPHGSADVQGGRGTSSARESQPTCKQASWRSVHSTETSRRTFECRASSSSPYSSQLRASVAGGTHISGCSQLHCYCIRGKRAAISSPPCAHGDLGICTATSTQQPDDTRPRPVRVPKCQGHRKPITPPGGLITHTFRASARMCDANRFFRRRNLQTALLMRTHATTRTDSHSHGLDAECGVFARSIGPRSFLREQDARVSPNNSVSHWAWAHTSMCDAKRPVLARQRAWIYSAASLRCRSYLR
jgi:hypothetical protein